VFKRRYYRNLITLSLRSPVLHSGFFQSEHVAAGEIVQTMILSEHLNFKPMQARATLR